jgi:hypothetical protein
MRVAFQSSVDHLTRRGRVENCPLMDRLFSHDRYSMPRRRHRWMQSDMRSRRLISILLFADGWADNRRAGVSGKFRAFVAKTTFKMT